MFEFSLFLVVECVS